MGVQLGFGSGWRIILICACFKTAHESTSRREQMNLSYVQDHFHTVQCVCVCVFVYESAGFQYNLKEPYN